MKDTSILMYLKLASVICVFILTTYFGIVVIDFSFKWIDRYFKKKNKKTKSV